MYIISNGISSTAESVSNRYFIVIGIGPVSHLYVICSGIGIGIELDQYLIDIGT